MGFAFAGGLFSCLCWCCFAIGFYVFAAWLLVGVLGYASRVFRVFGFVADLCFKVDVWVAGFELVTCVLDIRVWWLPSLWLGWVVCLRLSW